MKIKISKIQKVLSFSLALIFLAAPIILFAAEDITDAPTISITGPGGVLDKVGNILFSILLLAAVIGIVIGGFMYVTAAGDPGRLEKAKNIVIYSLIGLIIGFAAKGLVDLIRDQLR